MNAYEVERSFAAWARAAEFVEYEGKAFYHGTIDGHAVVVDDGTRGNRCYGPHVTVVVEITEPRGVLRGKRAETTPLREELRRVLAAEKALSGLRLDDGKLDVAFIADTEPDEMERVVERIVAACRVVPPRGGIYR